MTKLSELAEQVEALAKRIEEYVDQEIVDGSLSEEEAGKILVINNDCEERLALKLEKLVEEMLDPDNADLREDGYEVVWQEWAQLFRRLAERIEAASQ